MDILLKDMPQELIEDILLRLPPEEPASVVRAGLVCKSWCRILSDRRFRRRYRAFHQSPPLLGFLHPRCSHPDIPQFVNTSSASPFSQPVLNCRHWWPLDCRHGRVLIRTYRPDGLVVWDPATNDKQRLSMPVARPYKFVAAVVCATDGCDHLDCDGGPFTVIFVAEDIGFLMRASVYSSETRSWRESVSVLHVSKHRCIDSIKPSLLAGGTLYFRIDGRGSVLKYDLGEHQLSIVDGTPKVSRGVIITAEDGGGLRLVTDIDSCIYLWRQKQQQAQAQAQAGAASNDTSIYRWVKHMDINLETMLPARRYGTDSPEVIGFAEGTDTVFINRDEEVFTLDLKSRQLRKVGSGPYHYAIFPFMSFYTPDLAKGRLSLL